MAVGREKRSEGGGQSMGEERGGPMYAGPVVWWMGGLKEVEGLFVRDRAEV